MFSILMALMAADSLQTDPFQATAVASKDSVVFHIPVPDSDAVWEWNAKPKGAVEHQWVIHVPIDEAVIWDFVLVQQSAGPPVVRGSVNDLLSAARILWWDDCHKYDAFTFARPCYRDGVIEFVIYQRMSVERINSFRASNIMLDAVRADGSRHQEAVVVTHLKDPREEAARAVSGPFTPDEYAIYQTVIDPALSPYDASNDYQRDLDFALLNPTTSTGPLTAEANNVKSLGADESAVNAYLAKRSIAGDVSSLVGLGYYIVAADSFRPGRHSKKIGRVPTSSVRVSLIGFNHAGDQAIVYVETSCGGGLCGGGTAFRLDNVDGEWLVTRWAELW